MNLEYETAVAHRECAAVVNTTSLALFDKSA